MNHDNGSEATDGEARGRARGDDRGEAGLRVVALRPEDRLASLSDEQVCIVLPRLAHPSQAVLAAVKLLRALDRPITHEGGTAVLRPCVGVATA